MKRLIPLIFFGGAMLASAHARLGETLDQIKAQYGRPESQQQSRKDQAVWLFEVDDGQLIYNVTFDEKGRSIAEGLRPLKRAAFTKDVAQDFIQSQVGPYRNSKTLQNLKPGEKYTFGGQNFVCGDGESVIVDDANGVLIVWTQKGIPSVMAVSHVLVQKVH
jgi:hypothetical protein